MDKRHKTKFEQMFIKIIEELPNIDPRIKQIEKINGSIVVTTTAGEIAINVLKPKETS